MTPMITTERSGKVAVLRLARPPVNTLSVGLLTELQQAVESLAGDLPGAVVITGTDRIFSAGADITEFGGSEQAAEVARRFASVLDAIAALPRATLAVISGGAFGGGLELALACDFRFVASGARLGQPESCSASSLAAGVPSGWPASLGRHEQRTSSLPGAT